MKIDPSKRILIVGLGLLGGSYARTLKQKGFKVSAITKNQDDIDFALENGIIDNGTTEIDPEIIGSADLVVFALLRGKTKILIAKALLITKSRIKEY